MLEQEDVPTKDPSPAGADGAAGEAAVVGESPPDQVAAGETDDKETPPDAADGESPPATGEVGDETDPGEQPVSREQFDAQAAQLAARTEQLQRLQAEFHNYRRRINEEQRLWEQRAAGRVLTELLPVIDNLERAVDAGESGGADSLRQGVALILRQLRELLQAQGVEKIPSVGQPFDPEIHEAMMQTETNEVPDQHVLAEIQSGYRHGQTVLRPALVQVARNYKAAGADQGEVADAAAIGDDERKSKEGE